jgi:hypothetical protein
MSYKTLEVELENGRVHPAGGESLPANAHALLTILTVPAPTPPAPVDSSLAERVADLAGIGCGRHAELSSNRAHLDDFGR